jgi:RNA polymerase sigma-70 factor (ECF subfamily)
MTIAERFAQARPRLLRLAYSELGDLGQAEDVVQEAWLRLERTGAEAIDDLDAWLTTVVGRLALDTLRSARVRREAYVGPWLPEPVVSSTDEDPADRVTLDESVSYALLALLEQLSPAERTAFVLHDVFDVPFGDVAGVVGRTPEAVRQLASRARRHIAQRRPRFEASADEHDRAVRAFARAVSDGDLDGLVAVLDPEVVWTSDGGGRAIASRRPLQGAERVARAWVAFARKGTIAPDPTPVELNGRVGLLLAGTDGDRSAVSFTVDGGRIVRIDVVRNPEKLRRLSRARAARSSPSRGGRPG